MQLRQCYSLTFSHLWSCQTLQDSTSKIPHKVALLCIYFSLILKPHTTDIFINFKMFFFSRKGSCSEWLCRQQTKIVYSTPSKCVDIERKLSNGKVLFCRVTSLKLSSVKGKCFWKPKIWHLWQAQSNSNQFWCKNNWPRIYQWAYIYCTPLFLNSPQL